MCVLEPHLPRFGRLDLGVEEEVSYMTSKSLTYIIEKAVVLRLGTQEEKQILWRMSSVVHLNLRYHGAFVQMYPGS